MAALILLAAVFGLSFAFLGSPDGEEPAPPAAGTEREEAPPAQETGPQEERPTSGACGDLLALVDHDHGLPPHYEPEDLVPLSAHGIPVLNGEQFLRREAADRLAELLADAAAAGEELVVASGYRSFGEQQRTHDRWTALYGEGAGGMSAVPGHSEHQLGTAVDFTNAAAGYELWWPFGDTTASAWLEENAHRYGFILSYPRGREEETGYNWEPWHYRYIGVENARELRESGLSLQAFLRQNGVIPHC